MIVENGHAQTWDDASPLAARDTLHFGIEDMDIAASLESSTSESSTSAPAPALESMPADGSEISLEAAVGHHLAQRYDAAETMYRRLIAQQPGAAGPKHWLGFMLQQCDRLEEAHALIDESLQLDASHADWHYNFGILLARMDRTEQALQAFLNAIAVDQRGYFSWTNLGSLYEKIGDTDKAEKSYLVATQIDPDCPDAYYLLSALYVEQQRFAEAKRFHCLGFIAGPAADKSRIKLSMAYRELGRTDEAIALIDKWLEEEPDHPEAKHLAIAYKGLPAPQRCSEAYVESTYDGFASTFEATLSKLKYAGPQALVEELRAAAFAPDAFDTLELGCGTGLNGEHLKSVSSILTGVDLSQRMLDQASMKAIYDRLIKSEICAFLKESNRRYDLIACIDTLIYFGDLEEIVRLMARKLKPGGWLIVTTEKLIAEEMAVAAESAAGAEAAALSESAPTSHLNISGRYSHAEGYLRKLLAANGMEPIRVGDLTIRMEAGMPIPGQIVRARKLPVA
jgi:predicted TPR repeat methyltransferase